VFGTISPPTHSGIPGFNTPPVAPMVPPMPAAPPVAQPPISGTGVDLLFGSPTETQAAPVGTGTGFGGLGFGTATGYVPPKQVYTRNSSSALYALTQGKCIETKSSDNKKFKICGSVWDER
jgi:hypothetical protein